MLSEIHKEFFSIPEKDHEARVRWYEAHAAKLNKAVEKPAVNPAMVELAYEYARSLFHLNRLQASLSMFNRLIKSLEQLPERELKIFEVNNIYQGALFSKAVILQNQAKFSDSSWVLKRLIDRYPKEKKYRQWQAANDKSEVRKFTTWWMLSGGSLIFAGLALFFFDQAEIAVFIEVSGLLILAFSYLYQINKFKKIEADLEKAG